MLLRCTLFSIIAFIINPIQAAQVVSSDQCANLSDSSKRFLLVLKKNQDVIPEMLNCLKSAKISCASFSAIGALKNPTLAYFNIKTKKYQEKEFDGVYELLSLNGNQSYIKGKPFLHLHSVIGDKNYHAIAGHLIKATVGVTVEIAVSPISGIATREKDSTFDLNLINTK